MINSSIEKQHGGLYLIQEVVHKRLCTQCGFCAALCPEAAIIMSRDRFLNVFPVVDEEKCTQCRLCAEICSGCHFPFSENIFGDNAASINSSGVGSYTSLWSGYSLDNDLRNHASSGGVVSGILSFLLERSMVKGVLVVGSSTERVFEASARLVTSPSDVRKFAGSMYLPVSMDSAVRKIAGGEGPYAVVGLPCHIQAWRKAGIKLKRISGKVGYLVGLFCDHLVDVRYSQLLLSKFGVRPDQVRSIKFRGDGWPGNISVRMSGNRVKTIPYDHALRKFLWKSYLFTPRRCLLCYDSTAEFADISAGDAWLPEFKDDAEGRNIVIVRSGEGESLCRDMVREGKICLEPIGEDRIALSQKVQLSMKKKEIKARFRIIQAFGGKTPVFETEMPEPTAAGYIYGSVALASNAVSLKRWFTKLAPFVPWRTMSAVYQILQSGKRR